MGFTFAFLALDSQTDEKWQRNRDNARKAYNTARHFLEEHAAGKTVAQPDVLEGMSKLRNLLLQLGETFEE